MTPLANQLVLAFQRQVLRSAMSMEAACYSKNSKHTCTINQKTQIRINIRICLEYSKYLPTHTDILKEFFTVINHCYTPFPLKFDLPLIKTIIVIVGGKQWQTTPKSLPRMQCARAIPVTWLGSGSCHLGL